MRVAVLCFGYAMTKSNVDIVACTRWGFEEMKLPNIIFIKEYDLHTRDV